MKLHKRREFGKIILWVGEYKGRYGDAPPGGGGKIIFFGWGAFFLYLCPLEMSVPDPVRLVMP